ncbi:MarR family winged helix-turn-helix transcriptional regulator [Sporolactobacillus spathodeae]|uniref:DNA-binding MarR family transcriptional regulator n=1 Tax=Sporolactobacillus spathodeae TaxID=1465502 RepID=A0ABS2Q534_9BACL|nr:MarR family transcriptional regulator [Sporolactobacillus spathodeae]MBM7656897.1 DNA-binding MarR family transcriptional regulator [Sporolactobacillus spathodeae]
MKESNESIGRIEYEVVHLLRRADFKKTVDGKKCSLPRSCYLILCQLLERNPRSIQQLADYFKLDVSTLSRQVKALEARGLVSRKTGKADGRVRLISITESGSVSVKQLRRQRYDGYQELLSDWSPEEKAQLADLLEKLNKAIEQGRK